MCIEQIPEAVIGTTLIHLVVKLVLRAPFDGMPQFEGGFGSTPSQGTENHIAIRKQQSIANIEKNRINPILHIAIVSGNLITPASASADRSRLAPLPPSSTREGS